MSDVKELHKRFYNWLIGGIVLLHVALGVAYSLIIPIGEGYDEWGHFAYIRYVVTEGRIPASGQRLVPEIQFDMTHHPPLYYLIGALASGWVDMSDNLRPVPNPHLQSPGGGSNAFIHYSNERWPYQGSVLGFHVVRLVSVTMSALTVVCTYLIASELLPHRRQVAVAAMALVAFMPQVLFMGAIVNNDIAVTLFAALTVLALLRLMVRGFSWRRMALLFLAATAALLTKANAVGLLPVIAVSLGVTARRQRDRHAGIALARMAATMVLLMIALVGVLLAWERWNTKLEGHWSSTTGAVTNVLLPALLGGPHRWVDDFHWNKLPQVAPYAFRTFWGVFGWGNVPMDEWIYGALLALNLAALTGVILFVLRRRRERALTPFLTPLLTILAIVSLPIYLVLVTGRIGAFPGRYALPIVPGVGLLLAVGLAEIAPARLRYPTLLGAGLAMFALSLAAPLRYIAPAYASPPMLTSTEMERIEQRVSLVYNQQIELLGYEVADQDLRPGDMVTVYLYWRCLAPMDRDYSVAVQLVDAEQHSWGGIDTYLGHGSYPTSEWRAGDTIREQYCIHLGDDFPAPALAQLRVGVYWHDFREGLSVTGEAGTPAGDAAIFGRVRVARPTGQQVAIPQTITATFGAQSRTTNASGAIALRGYDLPVHLKLGEVNEVTLFWECLQPPRSDYTVFVHLVDAQGNIVAQGDSPPRHGSYPTSLWEQGDVVDDPHWLDIPVTAPLGVYQLRVGLYRLDTMERLPVLDERGEGLPDQQVVVTGVRVE